MVDCRSGQDRAYRRAGEDYLVQGSGEEVDLVGEAVFHGNLGAVDVGYHVGQLVK